MSIGCKAQGENDAVVCKGGLRQICYSAIDPPRSVASEKKSFCGVKVVAINGEAGDLVAVRSHPPTPLPFMHQLNTILLEIGMTESSIEALYVDSE